MRWIRRARTWSAVRAPSVSRSVNPGIPAESCTITRCEERPIANYCCVASTGTALSAGTAPNDLWCTDYKSEFKLGNDRCCYPLTVTDHASRYLPLMAA